MDTVLERVRALVERLAPEPICDDCITDRLGLTVRQHANHKTRELAGRFGIERQAGVCSMCQGRKLVVRKNGR